MPPQHIKSTTFSNQLSALCKRFKIQTDIDNLIEDIASGKKEGILYPGFGTNKIYKYKLPSKRYCFSKQKGFRIIYMHEETVDVYLFLQFTYTQTIRMQPQRPL